MKRTGLMQAAFGLFLFVQAAQADWTPSQRITFNSGYSAWPAIAVDSSGSLHVVWEDDSAGNYEIFYRRSTDGGSAWMTNQRLTWTSEASVTPTIAVDSSDNIHVVWHDNAPGNAEIYYRKSSDGGATWTPAKRLTWTSGWSGVPFILADISGNLHVVWYDSTPGNHEIYYKKSTNGGISWKEIQRISWTSDDSWFPSIAANSSGNVHVVWCDSMPQDYEIYYKKSTDEGSTWMTSQRITWNSGDSIWPSITADPSGNLHIVWGDETPGNPEIYYRKSTDGGTSWMANQRLTWTSGVSGIASIAVDSFGNLHVVWADDPPGNYEIYYRKSMDGGTSWTASQRITWTSGHSWLQSLALDPSGNLHVVWVDDTPGNDEIYYKKFIN